ncbi:MAG: hydrogenase accessory protein HypB, partial [bacterium]|nr:hydrogenase accessory protein HypB [bacterium]
TYRVAVVSAAEGHDKPAKYPALFRTAHVTVLTKIDLIPYLDFDEGQFTTDVRRLNPQMPILRVSCRTGEGVSEWVRWLQERLQTGYPSPQTPRDR